MVRRKSAPRAGLAAVVLFGCATLATGQVLIQSGDYVPPLGTVLWPSGPAFNADGQWAASVTGDASIGFVKDGLVLLAEGDLVAPGVQLDRVGSFGLDHRGRAFWTGSVLAGTAAPVPTALGVDQTALLATGQDCAAAEVAPGTTYASFGVLRWDQDGRLLVRGSIDDPTLGTGTESALLLIHVDPENNLISESVLLKDGDAISGQPSPVASVGPGECIDLNASGDVIYAPSFESLKSALYLNATKLAESGKPSPVPGRSWSRFLCAAINDQGQYAFIGHLAGDTASNGLLVLDGQPLVQEGDILPDTSPDPIHSLSIEHLDLGEDGRVAWVGSFGDEHGLFLNRDLVLRSGQLLDGRLVTSIGGSDFCLARDGSAVGLQVGFADGSYGAYRVDLGLVSILSGCAANPGQLAHVGGKPTPGETLTFAFDQGQAPGVFPLLAVSDASQTRFDPCGVMVPGIGEVLVLGTKAPEPMAMFFEGISWGGAPLAMDVAVPGDLLGLGLVLQGLFVDPAGVAPDEPLRLTNGLLIQLGL